MRVSGVAGGRINREVLAAVSEAARPGDRTRHKFISFVVGGEGWK